MAKFKNSDELRSWLDGQSREVSVVIAARAALRVLPLLAFENAATPGKPDAVVDDIVLPVFRVMAVLCSAARYPNANAVMAVALVAASKAAKAADAATTAVARHTAASSMHAAVVAFEAAAGPNVPFDAEKAGSSVTEAAAAARAAAGGAAAALWDAVGADATRIDNGTAPEELVGEALWVNETPDWAKRTWSELTETLLELDEAWSVWTDWYSALLVGRPAFRHATDVQNEHLKNAIAIIKDEIWDKGPVAVNAEIKRLEEEVLGEGWDPDKEADDANGDVDDEVSDGLLPVENVVSPYGFGWNENNQITVTLSSANIPQFPYPGSEQQHLDRLEACRTLAADLSGALERNEYQVRPQYRPSLERYRSRLPSKPGEGNFLLADAEARQLRDMFEADAAILSPGLAASLKVLLEQNMGLRVFYPEIEHFYRDVQAGRIQTPLPLDAVEGILKAVEAHTPEIFHESVLDGMSDAAAPTPDVPAIPPEDLPPIEPGQPKPPKDPLGEVDSEKARDYSKSAAINELWRAFSQGDKISKNIEGWKKAYSALSPHIARILNFLQQFLPGGGEPPTGV